MVYLPISFRVDSLALDSSSASETTLKDIGNIDKYQNTTKHYFVGFTSQSKNLHVSHLILQLSLCPSHWSQLLRQEWRWVRSRNCGCLVTWFCYQLIAKPGNKTATVPWPDPDVVGAALRSIDPTTSAWSRSLLPTKVCLILDVLQYSRNCTGKNKTPW